MLCGKQVRGRIDKKFCDDYCRNSFNNKLKGLSGNLVRNINNALGKNRRILEGIICSGDNGSAKTNKEKLMQMGFQFKYLTHVHRTKAGKNYNYCYDYGYLPLENDWFLVVKTKDN